MEKTTFAIGPNPISLGGPDITFTIEVTPDLIDFDRDVHPDNKPSKAIDVLDILVTCDTDPEWIAYGEVRACFDFRPPFDITPRTGMSLGFNPILRSRYSVWPTYGLNLDDLPEAKFIICGVVADMYKARRLG